VCVCVCVCVYLCVCVCVCVGCVCVCVCACVCVCVQIVYAIKKILCSKLKERYFAISLPINCRHSLWKSVGICYRIIRRHIPNDFYLYKHSVKTSNLTYLWWVRECSFFFFFNFWWTGQSANRRNVCMFTETPWVGLKKMILMYVIRSLSSYITSVSSKLFHIIQIAFKIQKTQTILRNVRGLYM
jgi:hypothetical protein